MEKLSKLCEFVIVKQLTRGGVRLCSGGKGKSPEIPVPFLSSGQVCVVTTFY